MSNLTGNDIHDLNEAYKQIYSEIEYDQLDEDWWNPSTWFGPSPQQKAEERRRLQQAQTAAAEKVDRMVGRAHQLPNSGTRYTVNLNPNSGQVVRRSEGQIAQLGGRRVKWEVDDKGKGKWVPAQPEFKPNLQYLGTTGARTVRINPNKDDMGRPIQSTAPSTRSTAQPTSQGRTSTTRPAVTTTRPATSSTSRNTITSYSGATNVRPVGTPVPTNMVRPVAGAPTQGSEVSIQRPVNRLMTGMPTVPSMAGPVGGPKLSARAQALRSGGPQGSARSRVLNQSFDPFDVVMGYLIDEGYADSEDSAVIIMSNMSEDWIQSIVEATGVIRADVRDPRVRTNSITAGGRVPPGEQLIGNIMNRVGSALRGYNPRAIEVRRPAGPGKGSLVSRNVPKPTGGTGGSRTGSPSTNYGRGF